MRSLLFAIVAATTLLSGCASSLPESDDPAVNLLAKLGEFTLNDLNVAMDLTGDLDHDGNVDPGLEATGDKLADTCYFFLADKVTEASNTKASTITVAGVISGFQWARNLKRHAGGPRDGLSDDFYANCGGLLSDVRGDVLKLIAKAGSRGLSPF